MDSSLGCTRGSVSPVARRGPGGQGVGRASEPPAYRGSVDLPTVAAKRRGLRNRGPAGPDGLAAYSGIAGPGMIADRLRALLDMRDAGLLTEDEYSAKRAELVARI